MSKKFIKNEAKRLESLCLVVDWDSYKLPKRYSRKKRKELKPKIINRVATKRFAKEMAECILSSITGPSLARRLFDGVLLTENKT